MPGNAHTLTAHGKSIGNEIARAEQLIPKAGQAARRTIIAGKRKQAANADGLGIPGIPEFSAVCVAIDGFARVLAAFFLPLGFVGSGISQKTWQLRKALASGEIKRGNQQGKGDYTTEKDPPDTVPMLAQS